MATRESLKRAAAWLGRLVLAGTFSYAGAMKLIDPAAFAVDLSHFRLLPHPLTLVMAVYLPWLEIACAAGVLLRWRERGAITVLLALCAVFTAALVSAAVRRLDIQCGCVGASKNVTLMWSIVRVVLLGTLAGWLLRQSRATLERGTERKRIGSAAQGD